MLLLTTRWCSVLWYDKNWKSKTVEMKPYFEFHWKEKIVHINSCLLKALVNSIIVGKTILVDWILKSTKVECYNSLIIHINLLKQTSLFSLWYKNFEEL